MNHINDRMERSGMRWSSDGGEAILKLRSLHLPDLWNDFWTFRTQRKKKVRHGEQSIIMNNRHINMMWPTPRDSQGIRIRTAQHSTAKVEVHQ